VVVEKMKVEEMIVRGLTSEEKEVEAGSQQDNSDEGLASEFWGAHSERMRTSSERRQRIVKADEACD
jgi:hypothetical protein